MTSPKTEPHYNEAIKLESLEITPVCMCTCVEMFSAIWEDFLKYFDN